MGALTCGLRVNMRSSWIFVIASTLLVSASAAAWDVVDKDLEGRTFTHAKASFGGYIQPRFRFSPDDTEAGSTGEVGFSVQRMRLELEGSFSAPGPKNFPFTLRQKTSIELMPDPRLQDAYVDFALGTPFQVRLGQFKAPSSRTNLTSDMGAMFPDKPLIASFGPEREMGAMFFGWWGKRLIEWNVGVFNGEGRNRVSNVNRKVMVVGRVAFSPLGSPGMAAEVLHDWSFKDDATIRPTFTVGYSITHNTIGPLGQQEAILAHDVDGFFHYRFFTAQGEFWDRTSDFEELSVSDYKQTGWYAQLSAFWFGVPWAQEHLALLGRVEQGDAYIPSADIPPAGPLDPAQATRRITAGVGFFAGKPMFRLVQDLRFVASYTVKQELEDLPLNNDEFNLSMNLNF